MSVVAWGGLELGAATGERSYFGSDTRTEAPLLGLDGRSRLLSSRPMVWSGERSYSLYLWHVPVILFLIEPLDAVLPALRIGAMVGISLALAVASYQLVERPFRRGLPRLDRPVPAPGSVATRRSV